MQNMASKTLNNTGSPEGLVYKNVSREYGPLLGTVGADETIPRVRLQIPCSQLI